MIALGGMSIMEKKESYISEKAHDVMRNFKVEPYGKVQSYLDDATRKTIAEAQRLKEQRLNREAGAEK